MCWKNSRLATSATLQLSYFRTGFAENSICYRLLIGAYVKTSTKLSMDKDYSWTVIDQVELIFISPLHYLDLRKVQLSNVCQNAYSGHRLRSYLTGSKQPILLKNSNTEFSACFLGSVWYSRELDRSIQSDCEGRFFWGLSEHLGKLSFSTESARSGPSRIRHIPDVASIRKFVDW